jgi:hypothetical protein
MDRLAIELAERENVRVHEALARANLTNEKALDLIGRLGDALLELKRDGMVIEPREAPVVMEEQDYDLPESIADAIEDQQFRLAQKRQVRAWARTMVRAAAGDEGKLADIEKRIREGVDYEGGEESEPA